MSEAEKQEGQKTVVSFIAGLLIGALLVWVFSGSSSDEKPVDEMTDDTMGEMSDDTSSDSADQASNEDMADETPTAPELKTGDGAVEVTDQDAGSSVVIESATFPNDEGWIAVRSYQNDQLGNILGAARFSKEQGLVPETISLLAPTMAGRTYAVVFFTEDGNREFNLSGDAQVEGVWETFEAK